MTDAPSVTVPHVDWRRRGDVSAPVILVLPGGSERSTEPVSDRTAGRIRMRAFAAALTSVPGASVGMLRYRVRGWNPPGQDPVDDVLDVLDGLAGNGPAVLVGHSMGGRAAVHAAAHPRVVGIVALAPWLTEEDPVHTVQHRGVVLAHGERDRWVPGALSAHWATRARGVPDTLARFVVPGDNHLLIRHPRRWHRLAVRASSALLGGPVHPGLADAWAAGARGDLAVPLRS